jgi:hypothetical protein
VFTSARRAGADATIGDCRTVLADAVREIGLG